MKNFDKKTIKSFGDEWSKFDQSQMSKEEAKEIFKKYFNIFPWSSLPKNAEGFDMGCGSGRWASFVAPRVSILNCIDPSSAIHVAKLRLKKFNNINFYNKSVDDFSLQENSQDFGYSLGVLHHVPNTQLAIKSCVRFLKPEAPLLLYLYYALDDRPQWFTLLWKLSDILRKIISNFSPSLKLFCTNLIATLVYYPIARICKILDILNINVKNIPLSFYKNKSFYTMRTDSRDRFGTILEHRFSKSQIKHMMENAGLYKIKFSENEPFWCVIGFKKK